MWLQKSPFPSSCCHRSSGQTNVTRVSPQCLWLGQNLQLGEFKRWESQQELLLSALPALHNLPGGPGDLRRNKQGKK